MPNLAQLQSVLDEEIPMCAQMGIRVISLDRNSATESDHLCVGMPLDRNRNHQQTAFAGSLNALCTIAGWSATYLLLRELGIEGVIVIRRSTIKYHRPVETPQIVACCPMPDGDAKSYFAEMLAEKGQAKLDLEVTIAAADPKEDRPAVALQGSYVVTKPSD